MFWSDVRGTLDKYSKSIGGHHLFVQKTALRNFKKFRKDYHSIKTHTLGIDYQLSLKSFIGKERDIRSEIFGQHCRHILSI